MFNQKEKIKSYFPSDIKNKLTSWEQKFISSLYNYKKEWTEKQKLFLNKIINKYNLTQQIVQYTITYIPYDENIEIKYKQKITTREYRRNRGISISKEKNRKIRK